MTRRDSVVISLHTHNDRGTGVAATELGLLAGADRVEGTLFGNGERTGNLDIITVALNLYTQGIAPGLDFSDLGSIRDVYERCTGMTVPDRQPYSGELVFTAFSGSHQDAIRKGLRVSGEVWNVPYLIIDPQDIGRTYDEVIRVNGQSGKGGIGYLLERECGIHLPKDLLREFGTVAGKAIDALGREVKSTDLRNMLWDEYIEKHHSCILESFHSSDDINGCRITAVVTIQGTQFQLIGEGNGPIDAFLCAVRDRAGIDAHVVDQYEHALSEGATAHAIGYIQLRFTDGTIRWGIGVDTSIPIASIRAILSAIMRK
jgi:2-isopropylmalate synthase